MYMCVIGTSHVYVCYRYQSCIRVLKLPVIYMCDKGISYVYVS